MDAPAGGKQEGGHTGLSHFPSAVLAFIFIARRIQPSISFVDREVDFVDPRTNHSPLVRHYYYYLFIFVRKNPSSCDCTEGRFFCFQTILT